MLYFVFCILYVVFLNLLVFVFSILYFWILDFGVGIFDCWIDGILEFGFPISYLYFLILYCGLWILISIFF